jgi:hypothetical protein
MRLFKMNETGNLGLAMAVVIIAFLSSVTMTGIALKDTVATRLQYDALQETHLLRYQAFRGLMACRVTDYTGDRLLLPTQYFDIATTDAKTTYIMKTRIEKANVTTGGGLYATNGYTVKSLVSAKRGGGSGIVWAHTDSPVKQYAWKDIRRSTFAGYHYFSDKDQSENADLGVEAGRVYFYGPDVIYGKVHSNSDIWMEQLGGGSNDGWPTFYGDVSTSGIFQSSTGVVPYETIFKENYFEHSPQIEFPATADLIQAGPHFPGGYDPQGKTIYMVTVNGSGYSSWKGNIQTVARPESIDVWANYPPPLPLPALPLFSYWLTKQDTIWIEGPSGSVINSSIYCENKTWIRGNFGGKQTWGCRDTLSLIGDIKLYETALGTNPDGGANPESGNLHDFVGLVSEKRIIIKYGYRSPEDSLRYHATCGSDGFGIGTGIWIYAAVCALGDGDGDPHRDGIFTFEYQHPHPSTPDIRIGNRVYNKIDLHLHMYPQTTAMPWPPNLDYPWFNPLWPEPNPYMERGYIHLYGSVAQRRRGFVHRSTNDPPNHNGTWNFPNYKYGGPSTGVNYPGATGAGVGYKKDYHFDNRLSFTQPPNFPETHTRAGLTPFDSESWVFKKPPTNF